MAIQSRYDIGTRVLGAGGFGSVTLGKDTVSGSPVAVKTVSKKHFDRGEVDMMRGLNTPHSIRYRHDFEVVNPAQPDDSKHCIVMDLVNGKDIIATYAQTQKALSLSEIRSAAYQLFEFLAALEEKNIVYIDLKPENMIWQKSCRNLTVVDLGTAHQIGSVYNRVTGPTPHYAPPDYLLGKPYSHAFDLWSAGVTLYTMICSRFLFEPKSGLTPVETFQHVLQQIVAQVGEPSRHFLRDGIRTYDCFDGNLDLRKTWPEEAPFLHWQESFLAGLEDLGATDEEKRQWLDLMTMLLSYENRGSAKEHLERPLFQTEMKVHLKYNPQCRCKLYIQRMELLDKPIEEINTDDLKKLEFKADFRIDKNCCIHLPQSAKGEYAIFVELNGTLIGGHINLEKDDILNITNFQERLTPSKAHLFEDGGEPDQKKVKTVGDE